MPTDSISERAATLLAPLRADPARTAILTDVDGTLAPIVERPEQTSVPAEARDALARLSRRFGVVGAVSGRRAAVARELVGVEGIAYAGNHGLELLRPGGSEPQTDPSLEGMEQAAADHLAGLDPGPLDAAGLRREDKGPIQALHWRGAADQASAEALAGEIADAAARAGLEPHWGRKVLELRPPGGGGKATAVSALIESGEGITAAAYAGDDRTDLDAFRRLRQMRETGRLARAICVGIASEEGPAEIREEADLEIAGPGDWIAILRELGTEMPFTDLLRTTVLLAAGEATALGAITAIAAGRTDDTRTITVAAVWWAISVVAGLYLGRSERAADGVRDALAAARTATSLPPESPSRIALTRLWPIGVTALIAGGLGLFFPGVAAIGAGYALLVALAWRTREAAVLGVEQRDGTRFYVEPTSAFRPVALVRTPGLGRDRSPAGHPPPPPPAAG